MQSLGKDLYLIERVKEEDSKGLILWNENENIKQKSCIKSVKSDFVIKKYTNKELKFFEEEKEDCYPKGLYYFILRKFVLFPLWQNATS